MARFILCHTFCSTSCGGSFPESMVGGCCCADVAWRFQQHLHIWDLMDKEVICFRYKQAGMTHGLRPWSQDSCTHPHPRPDGLQPESAVQHS
jgi:hypothetical protein